MNSEDLKIVRAALFAWLFTESDEQAPSEVDWNTHKDCWCDGWETGYRAGLLATLRRDRRDGSDD